MGCSGRCKNAVKGSRRGKPQKSRVANFSTIKKGLYFWPFLTVGRNRVCMGCSGRSFAVEGPRRGKPVQSRFANFSKKKGLYFWAFLAVRKQVMYGM